MEELHRGDDVQEDSRLPVAYDGRLSKQQVGDIRGGQMVSQRRDDMWCPSGVTSRAIRVERHVRQFPAHGPTYWNEHHRIRT